MSVESLWGDIADADTPVPPAALLREQATELGKLTQWVLRAEVKQVQWFADEFAYDLSIIAPALNDYHYTVLRIRHGIDLYPVKVTSFEDDRVYECADEEQFAAVLGRILSSDGVKRVIASLLAQSAK